jgi:putative membrane protein
VLKRFLLSWLINGVGLFVASLLFSGVGYGNKITVLIIASLIFGLVNSLVRPLIILLSLPAIVLTLGLFTFIVNAFMLWITSLLYPAFQVNSVFSAVGAVVIVWFTNYFFDLFIFKDKEQ